MTDSNGSISGIGVELANFISSGDNTSTVGENESAAKSNRGNGHGQTRGENWHDSDDEDDFRNDSDDNDDDNYDNDDDNSAGNQGNNELSYLVRKVSVSDTLNIGSTAIVNVTIYNNSNSPIRGRLNFDVGVEQEFDGDYGNIDKDFVLDAQVDFLRPNQERTIQFEIDVDETYFSRLNSDVVIVWPDGIDTITDIISDYKRVYVN